MPVRPKYHQPPRHVRPGYHRERKTTAERGYGGHWQRESKLYLKANPLCVVCGHLAKVVDHKTPHRGNMVLFWDIGNWQSMCKADHDKKTATEDGGFGRARATPQTNGDEDSERQPQQASTEQG